MSLHKLKRSTRKHNTTSKYTRAFCYTGNIKHIKAYIDKNKLEDDCIVEIYVRPLNAEERSIFGRDAKVRKIDAFRQNVPPRRHNRDGKKVETKPKAISGADLRKWNTNVQESKSR